MLSMDVEWTRQDPLLLLQRGGEMMDTTGYPRFAWRDGGGGGGYETSGGEGGAAHTNLIFVLGEIYTRVLTTAPLVNAC